MSLPKRVNSPKSLWPSGAGLFEALAAVLGGVVCVGVLEVVRHAWKVGWPASWPNAIQFPWQLIVIALLALVVLSVASLVFVGQELRGAVLVARVTRVPAILVVAGVALTLESLPGAIIGPAWGFLLILSSVIGFVTCRYFPGQLRHPVPADRLARQLEAINGGSGFEALPRVPHNDRMGRRELADAIFHTLESWSAPSLTVAVEGPWGIGKSTLLNEIGSLLKESGFRVVMLRAWEYRSPKNLLQAYFRAVADALGLGGGLFVRRAVFRAARQLGAVRGSWSAKLATVAADLAPDDELAHHRESLSSLLQRRRAFILIDDLDRLAPSELKAVLRAVRLASTFSGLRQVLAYDRHHLSAILGLGDATGARDYLAKIVNIEFPVSAPSEALFDLLDERLQSCLEGASSAELDALRKAILRLGQRRLMRALGTPRQVQRVATTLAVALANRRQALNLRDLFLLTILQYGWPRVFASIRERPELVTNMEWTQDIELLVNHRDLKEERSEYLNSLDLGDGLAGVLLEQLFPVFDDSASTEELEALEERRICHPFLFDLYFHWTTGENLRAIEEISRFAESVVKQSRGEGRQRWISDYLSRLVESNQIESFFDRWQLVFPWESGSSPSESGSNEEMDTGLVEDFAIALSKFSGSLDDETARLTASLKQKAAHVVIHLLLRMGSDRANAVARDVLREATSLDFAGEIVFAAKHPEKRRSRDGRFLTLEEGEAINIFAQRVLSVIPEGRPLLSLSRGERSAVVLFGGAEPRVRRRLLKELKKSPELLPRLLEIAAPVQLSPKPGRLVVERFSTDVLKECLPVDEVNAMTADLELESLSCDADRELVAKFRKALREEGG